MVEATGIPEHLAQEIQCELIVPFGLHNEHYSDSTVTPCVL